jgi:hypothetical protein
MTERKPQPPPEETRRGEHNELDYRNADEEGEFDERGSQGSGPEPPQDEKQP